MVQKDTRRRSSLILGILLALLLGVAAGFFVLAVPIRMLETVTTFTRLSKLMVQAEPPISPNDRTLLAVLAGILIAGIGWVLVDWLLFGRAGMSALIKPREDEYEDEDGGSFRPTDPLDLVSPVSPPMGDWTPAPSGDARRPLSARTDIGDPPATSFAAPAMPLAGAAPSPSPFGQILPGVGGAAPLLQPIVPPPLFLQPAAGVSPVPPVPQQPVGGIWGTPEGLAPAPPPNSWPPLDMPVTGPSAPAERASGQAPPSAPSWLPAPGARPDGAQPRIDAEGPAADDVGQVDAGYAFSEPPPYPVAPQPPPVSEVAPEPQDMLAAPPQPFFAPPPAMPPPPAVFTGPTPAPAARPLSEPGFDRARLEELLARLERGLRNRRAAASAAPAPPPAPTPPAPTPVAPIMAHRVAPPAAYAAPRAPEVPPPASEPFYAAPPVEPVPSFHTAPMAPPPESPAMPPAGNAAAGSGNDLLLDQPLHVTLDLLRNMVKR